MGKLLMLAPLPIAAVAADGTGAALLVTPDPKEVFQADRINPLIDIDLGAVMAIDTVFLGSIIGAASNATWSLYGGVAAQSEFVIQGATSLRAPDAAGQFTSISHAIWSGATVNARYIRIALSNPAGSAFPSAGVVMMGKAFSATYGNEWGAGRKVIDTGSSTPLPSGGFAIVEGVRKAAYSWTFGDLSQSETDALFALQLDRGETRPLLVVEDPAVTAGLRWRLHYGKLVSLRAYERRNAVQTRWEMTVEEWA